MSNNKINLMFVLMLIGIFIISISAANEHENQNDIDQYEISFENNKKFPKMESNLLKGDSDIFKSQFQDNDMIKVVIILDSSNELYIQSLEDNGAIIEAVYENLVQATVPVLKLPEISELPFVKYIRSPYEPFMDVVSETRSVTIDTSPPNKSVLIIDDDNDIHFDDDQSVDRFNSTFENLGYDVVIEKSADTSNSRWNDYDILVWSCGDDFTPVYNPEYKEMLKDYVTGGGNLILESGNIASWINRFGDQMEFRNTVLHATSDWVYCDVGNLTLFTQHPTATTPNLLPETINFTSTNPGDDSPDADAVRILPNAIGVYNWSGIKYDANPVNINAFGIITYDDDANENNGGQVIYYAFDIDDIDDPDVQHKLIENSEHWLEGGPIPPRITGFGPSSSVNDTAPATRTFNITVDQILNVTWYFNKELQEQDNLTTAANVTIITELNDVHNITAIAQNENGTVMQKWDWNVTSDQDILSYYRSLGSDPNVVETTDLLTAADDWKNNIAPHGFDSPITTQQLLILANEWSSS